MKRVRKLQKKMIKLAKVDVVLAVLIRLLPSKAKQS